MIDTDLSLIAETPGCVAVLRAYRAAQEALDAQPAEAHAPAVPAAAPDDAAEDESDADAEHEDSPRQRKAARWIPRIQQVADVEAAELSRIHGRLIAFGLLKCELGERSAGVQYQLTNAGKQVLNHFADAAERAAA